MDNSNSNTISAKQGGSQPIGLLPEAVTTNDQLTWQFGIIQPIFDVLDEAPPYQRLVVKSLALIHQHQVDPLPILEGLARELPRAARNEVWKLIANLEPGDDLLEQLQQTNHVLPDGLVQALILAQQNGNLSTVYLKVLQRGPQLDECNPGSRSSVGLFGPVQKMLFVFFVIFVLVVKVVPELKDILIEFDLGETRGLGLARQLDWWFQTAFLLLIPGIILFVLLMLIFRFRSVQGFFRRFSPTQWAVQTVPKSITRRRTLALLILAGRSVEGGILGIRSSKSIRAVFSSFEKIKDRIKHQADSWQTLRKFRQISPKEASLLPNCSPQAQAWLLRWNANHVSKIREGNRIVRGRGLIGIIQLFLFAVVFICCLILFWALIDLMNELSKTP